uniref:F-box domain-containing protein n=1 Tax=Strongyloides stercoralis TaxID=6248 RepID=A0A0K0EA22_STRER
MFSQDNSSSFFITSLPNEVLKIILQAVNWKTIYNIRLVSKFFNSFVIRHMDSLPKPRLMGLNISSFELNDGTIICSYKLINSIKTISVENFHFPSQNNKIENLIQYLQKMDLTNVLSININTTGKTIIFDTLNYYFKTQTKVYFLKLFIDRNPSFKDFSIFIQKMKYVTHLDISKICFHNQNVPENYTIPMIGDMRNLAIYECECTHFVNSTMINNFFSNNKELYKMDILSKCFNFEDQLVKSMINRQSICTGKKNCHNNYFVSFPHQNAFEAYTDVKNFFPCETYNVVHDRKKVGRFNAYKKCDKCDSTKCITFQYYKSYSRQNEANR